MMYATDKKDIPRENPVFYVEDSMPSDILSGQTRASSSNWNVKSVVEKCFDEDNLGEEAWLMTADGETSLSVTLAYSGTDTRYSIASQEVSFYFYEGSDLFHDDNKEQIVGSDIGIYVGDYTVDNTESTATVKLTAPDCYPVLVPWYSFYVVIKVKFQNGGTASVAKNIGISKPGVLLLHGLNSNSECFSPFKNFLMNSNAYISQQVLSYDYSSSATSSFQYNTHSRNVVGKGLHDLSDALFSVGIASSKYDMIGHSMGGILERMYCQEVTPLHTNKLMTLNTPHLGSGWGNIYTDVVPILEVLSYVDPINGDNYTKIANSLKNILDMFCSVDHNKQAVYDLALNSSAIQHLNNYNSELYGIPVCAVGTEVDWLNVEGVKYACAQTLWDNYGFLLAHIFKREIPRERNFLTNDTEGSDAVVSVSSQRGGLSSMFSNIYKGTFFNANHCASPEWAIVHEKLLDLLNTKTTDSYTFSMRGFGSLPSNARMNARKNQTERTNEYITEFAAPKETTFIKIDAESVVDDNYTHKIKLSHSNDMATVMAFVILSDDDMVSDYDKDEMFFDLDGYDGEYTIYAIGRTDYNALVMDSIKISLNQVNGINNQYKTQNNLMCSISDNRIKVHGTDKPYSITAYDLTGRVLLYQKSNASHSYPLPMDKGVFIIGIKTADGLQTFKMSSNKSYSNK